MQNQYQIISDGSCDLPSDLAEEAGIGIVPFYVSFDEKNYLKEIQEIGIRSFYQQMVDEPNVYPKSSMPSVSDFMDAFIPYVESGIPIICICITTKFSGSMQSAVNAKQMIQEKYPDSKITVMDATVNTVLQGVFVLEAAKMREAGLSYEDTIKKLDEIKKTGRIFFTVGNIEYLKHGGRIGKVTALAGSVLGISPVITLKEGEIFPSAIGRSRKKTSDKTIDLLLNYLKENDGDIQDYSLAVGIGYDQQEAYEYQERVIERLHGKGYEISKEELPIRQIGATISVHTGPYPLGLVIIKKWNA